MFGKGNWRTATDTLSPVFLRAWSIYSGWTNGGVYDDDGVVDTVKSKTAVEDVEWNPEGMRNDGNNGRIYGRGD